jgi:hypothetical protein
LKEQTEESKSEQGIKRIKDQKNDLSQERFEKRMEEHKIGKEK